MIKFKLIPNPNKVILFIDMTSIYIEQVHRNVLAASSQYFKTMFLTPMKESAEQRVTLDYNKDMFQLVLDYFYSEEIHINEDNFADVMEISHYLQV